MVLASMMLSSKLGLDCPQSLILLMASPCSANVLLLEAVLFCLEDGTLSPGRFSVVFMCIISQVGSGGEAPACPPCVHFLPVGA